MTRKILCVGLAVLCFLTGVLTAVIQSHNHDRGHALNLLKERCSMLEAINSDRAAEILACDYGPLPVEAAASSAAPSTDSPAATTATRSSTAP